MTRNEVIFTCLLTLSWTAFAADANGAEDPPAWDSLAAANGLLFLSLADGRVVCMGPQAN